MFFSVFMVVIYTSYQKLYISTHLGSQFYESYKENDMWFEETKKQKHRWDLILNNKTMEVTELLNKKNQGENLGVDPEEFEC